MPCIVVLSQYSEKIPQAAWYALPYFICFLESYSTSASLFAKDVVSRNALAVFVYRAALFLINNPQLIDVYYKEI